MTPLAPWFLRMVKVWVVLSKLWACCLKCVFDTEEYSYDPVSGRFILKDQVLGNVDYTYIPSGGELDEPFTPWIDFLRQFPIQDGIFCFTQDVMCTLTKVDIPKDFHRCRISRSLVYEHQVMDIIDIKYVDEFDAVMPLILII